MPFLRPRGAQCIAAAALWRRDRGDWGQAAHGPQTLPIDGDAEQDEARMRASTTCATSADDVVAVCRTRAAFLWDVSGFGAARTPLQVSLMMVQWAQ